MRVLLILLVLAGCSGGIPASNPGMGSFEAERARRDAQLRGELPTVELTPVAGAAVAAQPVARPLGAAPAPARPAGISDEQGFEAVSARESIESDAARRAAQAAAFEQVQPEALPERSGQEGPNIVAYALATSHAPGQAIYQRRFPRAEAALRNCARYGSPDVAQQAFLAAGGPERDRLVLDPDGDGFACGWDPRPFRRVRG